MLSGRPAREHWLYAGESHGGQPVATVGRPAASQATIPPSTSATVVNPFCVINAVAFPLRFPERQYTTYFSPGSRAPIWSAKSVA